MNIISFKLSKYERKKKLKIVLLVASVEKCQIYKKDSMTFSAISYEKEYEYTYVNTI